MGRDACVRLRDWFVRFVQPSIGSGSDSALRCVALQIFDIWTKIMKRVPKSKLWLIKFAQGLLAHHRSATHGDHVHALLRILSRAEAVD